MFKGKENEGTKKKSLRERERENVLIIK